MKRIVFLAIAAALSMVSLSLGAQEKTIRYRGSVELHAGAGICNYDYLGEELNHKEISTAVAISTTQGIVIKEKITVGLGFGIGPMFFVKDYDSGDRTSEWMGVVSVYAHGDYAFGNSTDVLRPYVAGRIGVCDEIFGIGIGGGVRISRYLQAGAMYRAYFDYPTINGFSVNLGFWF